MARFTVVVTDYEYDHLDQERRALAAVDAELVPGQCRTEDDVIALARDADGILNQYAHLTPRVLGALRRCQVIGRYGIGLDTVDIPAATRAGILVCNVPTYCLQEVSDHTIGFLLACVRKIPRMSEITKHGQWDFKVGRPIPRLQDITLGLVALGNIPRMVARKLAPWNMRILACDPYIEDRVFTDHGVVRASLDDLLRESDVVSVHLPLTAETLRMFTYARFKQMKRGAFFLNTARGPLVDEDGLLRALQEEWLAGAAIDVMQTEPAARSHPLLGLPNVIVTPHIAWYSEQSSADLQRMTAEEVARVLAGRQPLSCVNPEAVHNRKPR